jgi:hypothetical protein
MESEDLLKQRFQSALDSNNKGTPSQNRLVLPIIACILILLVGLYFKDNIQIPKSSKPQVSFADPLFQEF